MGLRPYRFQGNFWGLRRERQKERETKKINLPSTLKNTKGRKKKMNNNNNNAYFEHLHENNIAACNYFWAQLNCLQEYLSLANSKKFITSVTVAPAQSTSRGSMIHISPSKSPSPPIKGSHGRHQKQPSTPPKLSSPVPPRCGRTMTGRFVGHNKARSLQPMTFCTPSQSIMRMTGLTEYTNTQTSSCCGSTQTHFKSSRRAPCLRQSIKMSQKAGS